MKKTSALILAGLLCIGSFTASHLLPLPRNKRTQESPKAKARWLWLFQKSKKNFSGRQLENTANSILKQK